MYKGIPLNYFVIHKSSTNSKKGRKKRKMGKFSLPILAAAKPLLVA